MTPIITITFNPTIDTNISVPAMVPEKKLRCSEPVFEPGGGGINVARAIKRLGGRAKAFYLSGGCNGLFLKNMLASQGVESVAINIKNNTRENIIVLDKATNLQYRFCLPGPLVDRTEWEQLFQEIMKTEMPEYIVVSGSLAQGMPANIMAGIASIAKTKNAKLIVDTSGEALKLAIQEGVYMIKPNLAELASLAGTDELNTKSAEAEARLLIAGKHCEVVIVSMGRAGAMLVADGITEMIQSPQAKTKSTVGAGDSMVAGIVLSLSRGKCLLEAMQYGVACGTAATMNPGTELCRLKDTEELYRIIRSSAK